MFGTILPYIGVVISPCDADGIPSGEETVATDQWETKTLVLAWFGQCLTFGLGEVMPRMIDPANPRRFAPGNLA